MKLLTDSADVDGLEQLIVDAESLIAQLRLRQAEALATLDSAQVTQLDGSRSMIEWTAARLDVTHGTAGDLMTLAKATYEWPELVDELTNRRASFDRTVATAKLAASGASDEFIAAADGFDLAGIRRVTARHHRMTKREERDVFVDQYVAIQPTLDHSAARFWGLLPGFEARIFEKALRQRADQFRDLPGPAMPKRMRLANALVSIAQDSLQEPSAADGGASADPLVTVFVDADLAAPSGGEAGAEMHFGPKVGPDTLERILCGGAVQVILTDDHGPVAASHATRAIPPATRRYVTWRDGGCTIDGCRSRYRIQPHHVRHRSNGGTNQPSNLTTLCWYHHHVAIHGAGYRLDPESPPRRRRLLPPSGSDPP